MIKDLLNSNNISKYVDDLVTVFIDINTIELTFNELKLREFLYTLFDKDEDMSSNSTDLELYVSVININKFLEKLNNIKYHKDIEKCIVFQYIKKLISTFENNLIELLFLDKKTKNAFRSQITYKIGFDFGSYGRFCSDLCFGTEVDLSKYYDLNYEILSHIIKLKETTKYVSCMFNLLKHVLSCYMMYYSICTYNTINTSCILYHTIGSSTDFRRHAVQKLFCINSILHNYWLDYLDANRITIFLQSLIRDAEIMIVKMNHHNKDISKLNETIFVLTIVIESYEKNITNKLIRVVETLKIQQFISAILDHIDYISKVI